MLYVKYGSIESVKKKENVKEGENEWIKKIKRRQKLEISI